MDFGAASSSSSSSSSSSFSWTAPRDAAAAAADPSSDEDGDVVNSSERGNGCDGIDADAERKQLAAVRDFKGKTIRTQEEEKRKLEEPTSRIETDAMRRARLEEIRADFVTLKMLTSFKVGVGSSAFQKSGWQFNGIFWSEFWNEFIPIFVKFFLTY